MKIVVISDSHGDFDIVRKIALSNPNADIYLHLGDSQLENDYYLDPFVSCKGNCDYFSSFPNYRIIHTPYGNIYAEHGHLHSYINKDFLIKHNCKIYLFGHSHIHYEKQEDDFYFLNPGSVSLPRDGTSGTYLILDISKEKFTYQFKFL
ncbi:MAG: YfcE family phosphodiesterase [Bacillales bacterium]|nr:YfcE family phosphodiesterase [Bacillales bacterium]